MKRKIFGTDGVRGLANQFPMDPETALALGRAIAYVFGGKGGNSRRIVIGKDTRLSGYMIENALSSGICSMGGEAIFLGPLPTPGIAFITHSMRADAGVVISASHNPFYDNGIKFFDHEGFKLPDVIESKMEDLIGEGILENDITHDRVGRAYRIEDASGRYIEYLKSTFPQKLDLDGVKVVVDSANGASYKIAPVVFEELGAEVISFGVSPDGLNINEGCGALHPSHLQEQVRKHRAQLGIALDGDADRLVVVDEKGNIVHGDALLALFALELKKENRLPEQAIVATVMSNLGLEIALKQHGIQTHRVQVGDRYVIEAMRERGFGFGGEQSGHMIFLEHSTTGDGILAALQLLAILSKKQKPMSELAQCLEIIPQVLLNVPVKQRKDLSSLKSFVKMQDQVKQELGERGRILIRYSGTEPLLRIMLEGDDSKKLEQFARDFKVEAERLLGRRD